MIRHVDYTGSGQADASGNCTVTLNGPARGYVDVSSVAVIVTPGVPIPNCTAYDGPGAVPGRVLARLRAADAGTFRGQPGDRLNAGQQMSFVFAGCAVGAQCSVTLRGTTVEP